MTRGGARNRSGPQADPKSARSDRRGFKLTALPADGFSGDAPAFPLPPRQVFRKVVDESGASSQVFDRSATSKVKKRELELWAWAWATPQACAWSMPSESWRLPLVAMWVRTFVLCEGSEATAADKNSLHRFADQVGMTPAGLRENGWSIVADEVGPRSREAEDAAPDEPESSKPARRMRAVNGGA